MPKAYKSKRDQFGLTDKQRRFADAYIECHNITEAARQAGYSGKIAHAQGQKNMQVEAVSRYISARVAQYEVETSPEVRARIASGDEVNAFLSEVMRGEVRDAFGLDPSLNDRISAAKELRRVYDIQDKYRASQGATDDLSKSLEAFINGELAPDTDDPTGSQD